MVNLTQILIGFILSVVASIISALVTVRLSLKQFQSQRWWEKKAEEYSDIIKQLALLEFALSKWLEEYESGVKWVEGYKKRLHDIGMESAEKLMQVAASGAYIISEEAAGALRTLRNEIEQSSRAEGVYSALDAECAAVRKCIKKLREYAKADLHRD